MLDAAPTKAAPEKPSQGPPIALWSENVAERDGAWRVIYRDNFERIYRLVCRFGVPAGEVEDIVQQVFSIAFRKISAEADIQNLSAWLYGIAVRVVRDHHRWRRVRMLKQSLLDATAGAQSPPPSPEADAEAAQAQALIAAILPQMSPKLRAVLVLTDIDELSVSEAAAVLGIPTNTVRSRRQRARTAFQKLWDQRVAKGEHDG